MEETAGVKISEKAKNDFIHGASEIDLVRSGLDDTMRQAYQEMKETLMGNERVGDLRTSAYVIAVEKISRSYLDIGIY